MIVRPLPAYPLPSLCIFCCLMHGVMPSTSHLSIAVYKYQVMLDRDKQTGKEDIGPMLPQYRILSTIPMVPATAAAVEQQQNHIIHINRQKNTIKQMTRIVQQWIKKLG